MTNLFPNQLHRVHLYGEHLAPLFTAIIFNCHFELSLNSFMASWVQELHIPHLSIPVTVDAMIPVFPAGPIPALPGDTLYLSNLDDIVGVRVFTPTVYFYRSSSLNSETGSVIKVLSEALATVLVPYYPLSGRIRETQNGKLEVYFGPNQGALMVESHTEVTLESLGDLTMPNPAWLPLIYNFPNEEEYKVIDMPLVIAQVTLFSCGGFSLGLRLCHCICDGFGAMQFLNAWASTARSRILVADPKPCWDREFFLPRNPPEVKYPHAEFMKVDERSNLTDSLWQTKPVQKCYKISREFQARIKALSQQGDNTCSSTTFDAMAAHVWKSWVKSLDVKPIDYTLRLTFSVNARPKLENPPLTEGYYGNVVCVACAMCTVADLVDQKLEDTTKLVRDARLSISEEYLRSTVDFVEVDRPKRLEFGGKLTITQWTRFCIYECADFGWGKPVYAGPIDLTPTPQVCVFLPGAESDPQGTMLVCICLPESATHKFHQLFCSIHSSN